MNNLALVAIFGLVILGPSIVFAFGNAASINALARNPASAPKIFIGLVSRLVIISAVAISIMAIVLDQFA